MLNDKIVIAFIIDFLSSSDGLSGGTEKQLIDIIAFLDKSRFEPILICLRQNTKHSKWADIKCVKYNLDLYSLISFKSFSSAIHIVHIFRKYRVDIVNTFFFDSTIFGVILAKLASIRCTISSRRDMGFWYSKKILFILKIINLFTDRIIVNSEAIKNNIIKLEKIEANKVDVIYNGIDSTKHSVSSPEFVRKELSIPFGNFIVGIVANLNRKVKRIDLFIEASANILKEFPNSTFIIIGDGKLRQDLENQASELNIYKHILFLGYKKNIDKYLSIFDVGVISSDSEGFSNTILEYALFGVPVVSTNVGGSLELFNIFDLGELIPNGNSQLLSDAIIKLLKDSKRRAEISHNSKAWIRKKFSWNHKIREIEAYYLKMLMLNNN